MRTKLFVRLVSILACFLLALPVAADTLKEGSDLQADARLADSKHVPVLILFMAPGCHYCERVLNEFLLPMQRNREYDGKVLMRQIDITSEAPMKDFKGNATTERAFAAANKVRVTPTVKFFLPSGEEGADKIVGLLTADFYGGYLDNAIDEARQKLQRH